MAGTFTVVTAIIAARVVIVIILVHEDSEWQTFKVQHNCRVVGKTQPDVGFVNGIGSDGKTTFGTIVTLGKTGWQCDDGVTYWR